MCSEVANMIIIIDLAATLVTMLHPVATRMALPLHAQLAIILTDVVVALQIIFPSLKFTCRSRYKTSSDF
jgi:hypothetical protein